MVWRKGTACRFLQWSANGLKGLINEKIIDICLGPFAMTYISVQLQGHTKTLTDQCFVDSTYHLKLSTAFWRREKAHIAHLTKGSWPCVKLDKGKNRAHRRLCSELDWPFYCEGKVWFIYQNYIATKYPTAGIFDHRNVQNFVQPAKLN